jgi:hypothetical protein
MTVEPFWLNVDEPTLRQQVYRFMGSHPEGANGPGETGAGKPGTFLISAGQAPR